MTTQTKNNVETENNTASISILTRILCQFGHYFDGQIWKIGTSGKEKIDGLQRKKFAFLIVSKEHYSEINQTFPVDDPAQLKKILKIQYPNNKNYRYFIWPLKNGQSHVTIWHFKSNCPEAYIMLPETMLLSKISLDKQCTVVIQRSEKLPKLFVSCSGNSLHSIIEKGLIKSPELFHTAIGEAEQRKAIYIDEQELLKIFAIGLSRVGLSELASFVKVTSKLDVSNQLKAFVIPLSVICSLYLLVSSGYLLFKGYSLEKGIDELSVSANSSLQVKTSVAELSQRYKTLKLFLQDKFPESTVWQLIFTLFNDAEFSNIRLEDGRYVLRGSTEKSTKLLNIINESGMAHDAKFDFPVRKNRGKEVFVISFIHNDSTKLVERASGGY
ncbi:hypothetical protein [Thalassotalea marina]|uniref:Uncharacterized protein n=1 Tax=Thalassotalea marina TaxID=1673741 RepID=A0A919BD47_9GAMM|nr:hypothetical protein [Thalassotalea marina]GHF80871.1 hypothetical protein GCM10017161_05230 [Thalassotalea marina]